MICRRMTGDKSMDEKLKEAKELFAKYRYSIKSMMMDSMEKIIKNINHIVLVKNRRKNGVGSVRRKY